MPVLGLWSNQPWHRSFGQSGKAQKHKPWQHAPHQKMTGDKLRQCSKWQVHRGKPHALQLRPHAGHKLHIGRLGLCNALLGSVSLGFPAPLGLACACHHSTLKRSDILRVQKQVAKAKMYSLRLATKPLMLLVDWQRTALGLVLPCLPQRQSSILLSRVSACVLIAF